MTRTLSQGLADLLAGLESRPPASPADAAARLAGARLGAADLMPWADFDHPLADSYGRLLVGRGARFELMVMSWSPGDYSAIHDHGAAQWGAVRYFGPADHAVFSLRGGELGLAARGTTPVGSVAEVDADRIHLMGNPGAAPFLSLHLYGCDRALDSITGDARVFDLHEGRIQRTDGGVFFCLPEAEVSRREPGPPATPEVMRLHHRLMEDRIARMQAAGLATASLRSRRVALQHALAELEGPPVREVA